MPTCAGWRMPRSTTSTSPGTGSAVAARPAAGRLPNGSGSPRRRGRAPAVTWEVEGGQWTIVAMNADAGRRVVLDADVGAKVGWLLGVGIGLVVLGLLFFAGGVVLIVVAGRRASRPPAPPSSFAT